MNDDKGKSETDGDVPKEVADAWAAVLIDIHEKRRSEDRDNENDGNQPRDPNESTEPPT